MNTIFQPISPLWEAFPTSKPQTTEAAASGGSIFADILKSTVNNVRETEDEVAKNEYLLARSEEHTSCRCLCSRPTRRHRCWSNCGIKRSMLTASFRA